MTRTRIMPPAALDQPGDRAAPEPGSVEREAVPRDAIPRDAIPRDAIPRDAVPRDTVPGNAVPRDAFPGEVIPGDAIPVEGVPGEQLPENAAEGRILPVEGRTIEDREQRAGEAVRGPQRAIGAGEPARHERVTGRRRSRGVHGGVRVEQPAAARS